MESHFEKLDNGGFLLKSDFLGYDFSKITDKELRFSLDELLISIAICDARFSESSFEQLVIEFKQVIQKCKTDAEMNLISEFVEKIKKESDLGLLLASKLENDLKPKKQQNPLPKSVSRLEKDENGKGTLVSDYFTLGVSRKENPYLAISFNHLLFEISMYDALPSEKNLHKVIQAMKDVLVLCNNKDDLDFVKHNMQKVSLISLNGRNLYLASKDFFTPEKIAELKSKPETFKNNSSQEMARTDFEDKFKKQMNYYELLLEQKSYSYDEIESMLIQMQNLKNELEASYTYLEKTVFYNYEQKINDSIAHLKRIMELIEEDRVFKNF